MVILRTGCGVPRARFIQSFKLMWYKKRLPELYAKAEKFYRHQGLYKTCGLDRCGTATDRSYASGSGLFDLAGTALPEAIFIDAAGLDEGKLPEGIAPPRR